MNMKQKFLLLALLLAFLAFSDVIAQSLFVVIFSQTKNGLG